MESILQTPLVYLPGLGSSRASLLSTELKLRTYGDLLYFFPFRYVDRSQFCSIQEACTRTEPVQVVGTLSTFRTAGHGRKARLSATLSDESGQLELIWFKGLKWVSDSLSPGQKYIAYGKVSMYKGQANMAHPEMQLRSQASQSSYFQPIYSSTEKLIRKGLASKGIEKLLSHLLQVVIPQLEETLSREIREALKLISRQQALRYLHQPAEELHLTHARRRIKFEELFFLQMELLMKKASRSQVVHGAVFSKVGQLFSTFYDKYLPFELTGAQKRVIKEIRKDLQNGVQMNRLLQGDVGSGKTAVAVLTALLAADNGYQTAVMAPTEILATQHYASFSQLLHSLPVKLALLTGSTSKAERDHIDRELRAGSLHILIGTHALLEDRVKFKNLGLAVIDEQHRFGVAQRARLWKKNRLAPHVLVMTATPIPRTLSMTLYGDLDVSVIDELPSGRKPIVTSHLYDKDRLKIFGFMEEQIASGRQVYVVYPLIEESATLELKDLMDGYESLSRRFAPPGYSISILHGRMSAADKDLEMARFAGGQSQIMVATTVIEVGVNVPNASVMVIENAERFGLTQLHQLRGRVGRGAAQSYCLLVTGHKLSREARIRLQTMVRTNDGFEIAEADLRLRGPGDMMGTQQSGIPAFKLADLSKDVKVLQYARKVAQEVLEEDPSLALQKNAPIARQMMQVLSDKPNWSRIS